MIKKVFIDLETTGLNPKLNGIIEIGMIFEAGSFIDELSLKMSPFPADEISNEALKVNKVSREDIFKQMNPKEAYKRITNKLSKYVDKYNKKDKLFFIGYNANFDADFLRTFFEKNGDNYFGSFFFYPIIDVAVLAGQHLKEKRYLMPNFKLMTVASEVGIHIEESKAHGAMYDIQVTKKLYDLVGG